jgi:divalent metal cation (Fe/Co/Zn/Cd) transporter
VGLSSVGPAHVDALVDKAPEGMEQRIANAVLSISGVQNCHNVRVRPSGPSMFIDLHVVVDGKQSLSAAHDLTDEIEATILRLVPEADVTVHAEPF